MLEKIGGAGAGFFGARFIPQNVSMLAQYNSGIAGYALNGLSGFAISVALSKFWSRTAGQYALVGTGLAVLSRIIVEKFGGATPSGAAAMSGDLDFDLGYYVSERFPFPQGAGAGPWDAFPGNPWGGGGYPATAATAVRAGQAAASAALPASATGGSGAAATLPGGPQADRWSSVWA